MEGQQDTDTTFECHSDKQEAALFSEKKITILCTGLQFGKTMVGAMWLKRLTHLLTDSSNAFIVASPTYKIMQQSTIRPLLRFLNGYGEYSKSDALFKLYHGGTIYFRTGTDPDSVVGITNVRGIWGDEAGLFSLYFWENLQMRASFRDAPLLLTTTPYTFNWLYKDVVRPTLRGQRNDTKLISASSIENPYFPKDEYYRRKEVMDPRRFNMMYNANWERMEGLVYDCWDEEEMLIDPIVLPTGTKYYAGIDWGYTDPFVCVVHAVTPNGDRFQVNEFYKTGMALSDQIELCKSKQALYGISKFYCDPSQPGSIDEFNRSGISAEPAENDIKVGVDRVYRELRGGTFKIFRPAKYTVDEIEMYHYPELKDLKPDQASKDDPPVDQHNHVMDAIRYNVIMTTRRRREDPGRLKPKSKIKRARVSESWS